MAKLEKKTKTELIEMYNKQSVEVDRLRRQVQGLQEKFDATDRQLQDVTKQKKHLENDMEGTLKTQEEERVKYAEEIQKLRDKVCERNNTINEQVETYKKLRAEFDDNIAENIRNKNNAAKYKIATIVAIIAFVVALIYACV